MSSSRVLNTEALLHGGADTVVSSPGKTSPEGYLEVIPGRLYWASLSEVPRNTQSYHFFSVDNELVYEPFFADFGPLNLSSTYRYCKLVKAILDDPQLSNKKIVHFCSQCPKKRANAAYLICCFQVMLLRRTAEVAYRPFNNIRPGFMPFRDATSGMCTYQCTVLDCVQGLEYAMRIRWFDPNTFDVAAYEFYERVENGNMNWVVPDKFLAFAGPSAASIDPDGYPGFTPEDYVPIFRSGNINLVVRLNRKQYDRRRFTDHGIKHADLYFLDGSCPPVEIITKFLNMVENEPNAIAVHCKAGLGRTGTLIGLWSQKHFGFPGRAYIGWNRICRPGAMLGPQQQFLVDMEGEMIRSGRASRINLTNQPHLSLTNEQAREDVGQGERLTKAKRTANSNNNETGGKYSQITMLGNSQANSTSLLMSKFGGGSIRGGLKPLGGMFGPQELKY